MLTQTCMQQVVISACYVSNLMCFAPEVSRLGQPSLSCRAALLAALQLFEVLHNGEMYLQGCDSILDR